MAPRPLLGSFVNMTLEHIGAVRSPWRDDLVVWRQYRDAIRRTHVAQIRGNPSPQYFNNGDPRFRPPVDPDGNELGAVQSLGIETGDRGCQAGLISAKSAIVLVMGMAMSARLR